MRRYLPLAALLALLMMLSWPSARVANAQGALVRIAGVGPTGKDIPVSVNSLGNLGIVLPSATPITTVSGANAAATLTIPAAGAGLYHYITHIRAVRSCTAAITGTATLDYTTTNIPNSMTWTVGNACAVGSTNVDIDFSTSVPIKVSAANTNTTIVTPAAGTAGIVRVSAFYYTAQ
jgi:hypothetical protein